MTAARKIEEQPVYGVAPGAHMAEKDAQILGPVIHEIQTRMGVCRPEMLVEEARSKSSPAHTFFDWNDKSAAAKHRIERAGYLIRSITIELTIRKNPVQTRAFQVVTKPTGERGYVAAKEVFATHDLSAQVVAQALGELNGWRSRYGRYKALAPVMAALSKALGES